MFQVEASGTRWNHLVEHSNRPKFFQAQYINISTPRPLSIKVIYPIYSCILLALVDASLPPLYTCPASPTPSQGG
jgi:hypothetical protein